MQYNCDPMLGGKVLQAQVLEAHLTCLSALARKFLSWVQSPKFSLVQQNPGPGESSSTGAQFLWHSLYLNRHEAINTSPEQGCVPIAWQHKTSQTSRWRSACRQACLLPPIFNSNFRRNEGTDLLKLQRSYRHPTINYSWIWHSSIKRWSSLCIMTAIRASPSARNGLFPSINSTNSSKSTSSGTMKNRLDHVLIHVAQHPWSCFGNTRSSRNNQPSATSTE